MRTDCDWCGGAINVPDGSVHTNMNIVSCHGTSCAHNERTFRVMFSDEELDAKSNKGAWLKERIQWTKPASGS